jgi:hypothetical protein
MEEASNGSFPVSREKPTRATTENDDEDEWTSWTTTTSTITRR